jgi:serine/threonine-protein kinase RsbW/non-specific serine/threonine protein kinase
VISGNWHQCLVVQELMACCARTYEFEDFAVRKAVKEALTNAFKHGNGGAPEKCIRIDYEIDETEFRVAITDEGSGFDHEALETLSARPSQAPAGRGLGLMQHYMTDVRFNGCGNRVELSKRKGRQED